MALSKEIRDQLFEASLELLEQWAVNKNWMVEFEYLGKDEMDPGSKTISISTRQSLENQVYTMLHECGHVLVQTNHAAYAKRYPATAKMNMCSAIDRRLEKTKKYKVDVLSEEIEAWQRGLKLADRLGIYVEKDNYIKIMNRCIFSYVEWAAGLPGYGRK